jgi:hypothetical protein
LARPPLKLSAASKCPFALAACLRLLLRHFVLFVIYLKPLGGSVQTPRVRVALLCGTSGPRWVDAFSHRICGGHNAIKVCSLIRPPSSLQGLSTNELVDWISFHSTAVWLRRFIVGGLNQLSCPRGSVLPRRVKFYLLLSATHFCLQKPLRAPGTVRLFLHFISMS